MALYMRRSTGENVRQFGAGAGWQEEASLVQLISSVERVS